MSTPSFAKFLTKKIKRTRQASSEEPIQTSAEGDSFAANVVTEVVADVEREGGAEKRQRRGPIELSSSTTPSPPPPPPSSSHGPLIITSGAAANELWGRGLTSSYREASSRPPAEFTSANPLAPKTETFLNRLEEDVHKAGSIVGCFRDLRSKYSASEIKSDELLAEKTQLSLDLEGTKKRLQDAEALQGELQKTQTDLTAELNDLRTSSELSKKKLEDQLNVTQTELKDVQAKLGGVETELEEAKTVISEAASDFFDNAIAQIRLLHPDLAIDGISFTNIVRDGKIIPLFPDEEGDGEEGNE